MHILLDLLIGKINNPYFRYARLCIAGKFMLAIIVKRSIGHFNQQFNIARLGM